MPLIKRVSDLQSEGPTIEIIIWPPLAVIQDFQRRGVTVPNKKGIGLIDTGASNSCIDATIASELGLISRDYLTVLTPNGPGEQFTYDVALQLPTQLQYKSFFVEVFGSDLKDQPYDALIGRDVLSTCTLIFNGWDNSFQLHV